MTNPDSQKTSEAPDYIGHRQRLKLRFMSDIGRSMPDYEMLELMLTYALPRRDVKPLAKKLLRRYPNLASVVAAPAEELNRLENLSFSTIVLIKLFHACSNKICWENLENRDAPILSSKNSIVEYCRSCIGYENQEQLLVIFLNLHGEYIGHKIEHTGTLNAVMISPRTIVTSALSYNAAAVLLAHNHPSGSCIPSTADVDMTRRVKEALKIVEIHLEDHIIISPRSYYSMREHLPFMNT